MRAILAACLMQAQDQYKYFRQVEKDNCESQLEVECLKAELQWERDRTHLLEPRIEIMSTQAKKPPSVVQIRKLIAGTDPKDWDGDIWGDSDEASVDETEELEEKDLRPLIKMERHTNSWGPELCDLRVKFSRKPGETETEYVWRVSLTGGDRMLLSGEEAQGFGDPRISLEFLINTGAQISVLNKQQANELGIKPSRKAINIIGVTGAAERCPLARTQFWLPGEKWMTAVEVALSPYKGNILGFDILAGKQWRRPNGSLWSFGSRGAGTARIRTLQSAPALPPSKVICISQYPLPSPAKRGIMEVINDLEKRQIISCTSSPYNSPFWPVHKPDGQWQLIIDYRKFNSNTPPLMAAAPNITSVVTAIQAAAHLWMAALDVKGMLFMIPLREEDKSQFAFTWQGTQYTFNWLPQGYKQSPTITHNSLAALLDTVKVPSGVHVYQHIDDILVGGDNKGQVGQETEQRYSEWEKGLLSLTRAVKEVERLHTSQDIIVQGPFPLLNSILKGSSPPEGVAQKATIRKWYAYLKGVSQLSPLKEGPAKASRFQQPINPDLTLLSLPDKLSPVKEASVLTQDSDAQGVWFTDTSAH
ncbi:hypothetical protein QYF61_024915 [Mycteria americana]|uniref:ribonuclease H n=1 Tax=Mycteria americana TaxID=33587 RepID=A0AAN7RUG5_MYCAM|nr:hypothetical protein QYF61_024915 [Mycteria americana]